MAAQNNNNDHLVTKVAVLERDVNAMTGLYDRLDVSIVKLTEVANSIKQLIAIHESKIDRQQEISDDLFEEIRLLHERQKKIEVCIKENMDSINKRFETIDKFKWTFLGGAVVVGYIFSKVNIFDFLSKL